MNRGRILSQVEGTWGRGTVYTDEPETDPDVKTIKNATVSALRAVSSSTIAEEVVEVKAEVSNIDESFYDIFGLPFFKSSLFATILEDTITEMRILAECNNEIRIHKTLADMPLLLALKYRVSQPPVTDELDAIDHKQLHCVEYKLHKLDGDRKYLTGVLLDVYKGLSLGRSFKPLHKHVSKIVNRDNYRVSLEQEELKHRGLRRELAKQLRLQRNHIKTVIYDTDVVIDGLKTEVEDAALNSEIRSRYIDNWQRARTEQHLQTIHDEEYTPSTAIEYYKQRSDHEQRVHSEVELLVNIVINETLEKIEEWMEKYDKDMERIDLKIQIKKNDYQNELEKRIKLEETIEKHDQMMKDWTYFKDEREKARLYREKMTKSAITVQAWWRGLLVRKQLGPFKVSKKKGGGKK